MNRFGYYFFYGGISFIALIALVGSLAYLSFGLTLPLRIIVFILSAAGSAAALRYFPLKDFGTEDEKIPQAASRSTAEKILALIYAAAVLAGIFILLKGRSDRPLITPWETVSALEFLAYGAASLCLFLLSIRYRRLPACLLIIHYAWSFGIFLFVYAIGYGFDPFIHEASVKAIEAQGRIQPLTPYYLGQYSLVTVFHSLFGGTIAWWSKILVPLLAAVFIPLSLKKTNAALLLLAFSFSLFTLTTPQNLAYVFLALTVLISYSYPHKNSRPLLWVLAGAALLTQPIAGIPALLLAASTTLKPVSGKKFRPSFNILVLGAYLLAVPLAFYFFGGHESAIRLTWPNLPALLVNFRPGNPASETWWLNYTYLLAANRAWLYALLALGGLILALRRQQAELWQRYGLPALALTASAILTLAIDFHFLIDYERADYPLRLLVIAALFTLPLIMVPLENFWRALKKLSLLPSLPLLIFLAALLSASLYVSYPRFDNYHNSHGYAVSKADILAVNRIEADSAGQDYIVLSNQQVSAAALREFSFKKYYSGGIFYYPIPTGGPLYAHFLAMIKQPSRESANRAMDLAGVKLAYFVLDDYWWAADKIAAEAELIADASISISNDQVRIYKFIKK